MKIRSLLVLTALCTPLAAQTTYYVDQSGVSPGSGTQGDPFTSIQDAVDVPSLGLGDTILVAPGTYVEPLDITAGGFRLVSSEGPLVTTITRTGLGPTITLTTTSSAETTLDGFTVSGATHSPTAYGYGFLAVFGKSHVTNCILTGNIFGMTGKETRLTQSTVAGNDTGVFIDIDTEITIVNTLFDANLRDAYQGCFNRITIVQNCILDTSTIPWECSTQTNVYNVDPETWGGGDFHVRPGSPAIGTGTGGLDIGALAYDSGYAPTVPSTYCESTTNSLGCLPSITFTGTPSAAGGSFDVGCGQVLPNKLGLLFYGYEGKEVPYQGGSLCVKAPARRTPVQSSSGNVGMVNCTASYTYDFAARIASGIDPALVPGQTVFAQYWYRDPQSTSGFTTGRSDALGFQIAP